jgi:hypothetical protein
LLKDNPRAKRIKKVGKGWALAGPNNRVFKVVILKTLDHKGEDLAIVRYS